MKTLLYLLLFNISANSFAQIVNVPDTNFKNALIEEGVDANNDGEIQVSEAEAVLNLSVNYKNISSLEGIQSFVNLEELYCSGNQLTMLDMSQNLNLQKLTCIFNQLNSLNVTQNINLKYLWCEENLLSNLDISQNINLETLWCANNQLTTLEVSQNLNLKSLLCWDNLIDNLNVTQNLNLEVFVCSNNHLTGLDLSENNNLNYLECNDNQLNSLFLNNGNNHNMGGMFSTGNVSLMCIQVDDENAIYPECEGFPLEGWCKDDWSSYSEDCSLSLTDLKRANFSLYPNPAKDKLFLSATNPTENLKVKIFNIEGKLLSTKNGKLENQIFIDVSNLSSGMYFINIEDENGNTVVKKFIKE
ncbi:T9SS type A sorting domain-containing protein [Aequorivita antarctica]|uniref:T9SS type A sorting domain-containing protein n=1 Tax=Aequorivita antarctica TaxID=153266 RepID=UPI000DBBDE63|nr:T9SS type A sorting domain-containing protein [Aequorivita antarctica]SRX72318.1 Internalin-J [Aequorivita antarctica]